MTNTESIGEEGYYFATFQTSIAIISCLHQQVRDSIFGETSQLIRMSYVNQILHEDEDAKIFNSPKEARASSSSSSPSSSPQIEEVVRTEHQQELPEPSTELPSPTEQSETMQAAPNDANNQAEISESAEEEQPLKE